MTLGVFLWHNIFKHNSFYYTVLLIKLLYAGIRLWWALA